LSVQTILDYVSVLRHGHFLSSPGIKNKRKIKGSSMCFFFSSVQACLA
jgi:hypothetical protein